MCSGDIINTNNIARDCGIDRTTVQSYYQILVDTMSGYFIYPYKKRIKRDIVTAMPKFYLFDVGISNYIAKRSIVALKGEIAGKSFEHYIFMELTAYLEIRQKRSKITWWRTRSGLEVDFIIGDATIALEVKISNQIHASDIKGLFAFVDEHPEAIPIVVSLEKRARILQTENGVNIRILPWHDFLTQLWQNEFNIL